MLSRHLKLYKQDNARQIPSKNERIIEAVQNILKEYCEPELHDYNLTSTTTDGEFVYYTCNICGFIKPVSRSINKYFYYYICSKSKNKDLKPT